MDATTSATERSGHQPSQRLVPMSTRTETHPNLLDLIPPAPPPLPDRSIDARFRRFHAAHPEVYRELVTLAREAVAAGRPRVGLKMLFEVVRWTRFVRPDGDEGFRLNNIYTSRYARLIEKQEPDLVGVFTTRELKSA